VTSAASKARLPAHPGGSHLSDVCDETIDTGAPIEDALVSLKGSDRPFGGSSTVVATVISHELVTRTAAIVLERGGSLQTFVSPTVAGASLSSNDEVFASHRALLHEAEGKALR
jgi:uncharacterized phosphosugar-binding protein